MPLKLTVPKAQKLSLLLIVLAIAYFYFQVEYDVGWEKSKVDENAVQAEWVKPTLIGQFQDQFGINERTFRSKCSSTHSMKHWISNKWNEYSIVNAIFNDINATDSTIIYGVHKSPFSDGKTATIIGLTYDIEDINYVCSKNKIKNGLSSISSFITISTGLSTVNWLSKDIIFMLIERNNFNYKYQQNQLLQNKHSSYSLFESFTNKILPKYTSVIVGGLIIEIPLYSQSRVLAINIAGPLGFQPNYDIIATSIVAFKRNNFVLNVSPYFKKSFWNNQQTTVKNLEKPNNLRKSMIRSMAYQSVGKTNGYHGYLIKHQIDALSLVSFDYYNGNKYNKQNRKKLNIFDQTQINIMFNMIKSIELFTRGMSNLIEIFHHATFNYIIISQTKFITMVKYSIPIGLIGLSSLIESYAIYTNCYTQYFNQLLFAVITLFISILFAIYIYFILLFVNLFHINVCNLYLIIIAVFLILIGIAILLKLLYIYINNKNNYYTSFITLLIIYSMFSQIWLPIALNFSMGLYFVTITAVMLCIVRKRAKLEQTKKTVFVSYGVKFRLLRMILLTGVPIGAILAIMFIMDINLFSLMMNFKYDLLNEDIYNKHAGWIVIFLTIIPTYVGCWFLLIFC